MKLMYRTPPYDEEEDVQTGESEVKDSSTSDDNVCIKIQWDDDCPWTESYSAEDHLRNFELSVLWSSRVVESSLDMAELENASLFEAEEWLLLPVYHLTYKHTVGFASQLKLLLNAFNMSFSGQFMEDFISVERQNSKAVKSSSAVPPPSVLDRVLKDIFHEALAILWIELVREVRWFWEESQPLPRMLSLSTHLIRQKLQMLAICIVKLRAENLDLHDEKNDRSKSAKLSGQDRKGSAGFAGSMILLNSRERMHVPYTQYALIMTEDMYEERMQALAALGNSLSFAAKLERVVLSSDMSAYKAANPAASFEDFLRWHSPSDWEDENPTSTDEKIGRLSCDSWPPRGRLSQRMSEVVSHGSKYGAPLLLCLSLSKSLCSIQIEKGRRSFII